MRKIYEFPNTANYSLSVRNIRIQKGHLRKYFAHLYSARLATKLLALFDFSMPIDYRSFYKQLQEQIVCQTRPDEEVLLFAKQFVFNLFDMNCDGAIDQADLFSFFKDVKNESLF
jgi:Ca2+-binding EF-hand superfamily protein